MLRVPLPLRGVAVLLLAASTVAGQTIEPPADLPLEPIVPGTPDFFRQYSADSRHPLLQFMADGEFVTFDAAPSKDDASRLKPTPDAKSKTPSTDSSPPLSEVLPEDIACPEAPSFLPYACPPPPPPMCYCRKCQRQRKHAHGCNSGAGCGNPYLGWPGGYPGCYGPSASSYQGCGCRKCRHHQGCGYGGCGYGGCGYAGCGASSWGGGYGGFGGGCGIMGCDGFTDGCCGGCSPYLAPPPPPPPPPCFCRKCRQKHAAHQGGYGGYGSSWGGCGAMGYDGFMDGCYGGGCAPPPPPSPCRRCQRKHGCSYGYGYAGCGYPGWPAYPVPGANMVGGGFNSFTDPNCYGCGKQHCHGLFHRCRGLHHTPVYPQSAYPSAMPCMMEEGPGCMDCGFGGGFSSALVPGGASY